MAIDRAPASERLRCKNTSRTGYRSEARERLLTALPALLAIFRLTRVLGLPIPIFTDGAPRSTGWWGGVLTVFGIVGGAELIRVTGSGDRCPCCPGVLVVSGAVALSRGG